MTTGGPILVRDVLYGYHKEIEETGQDFFAHKTGFTPKALMKFMVAQGFARGMHPKRAPLMRMNELMPAMMSAMSARAGS